MTERLIFSCENCGVQIVVESGDPQEVGQVWCDCTQKMDFEGVE